MTKAMKLAMAIRSSHGVTYDFEESARIGCDVFKVKSQADGSVKYRVTLRPKSCECRAWIDQPEPRRACKHIEASRLENAVRTRTAPEKVDKRRSYPNAPWYEDACRVEYRAVRELLRCLGALFPYERPNRRGRPPVCYGDLLVVGGLARYNDDASRFAIPDPPMLIAGRYLQTAPPQASTLRDHMRTEEMLAMLLRVFDITADVVRPIETEFVMDSTFVATPNNETVLQKIGRNDTIYIKAKNLKINIAAGVKTHVMVGAYMLGEHESDQVGFIPTLEMFWDRFRLDTVYADPGYDRGENFEAVAARGGVAMIKFRDAKRRHPQGLPHHDAQLARYLADESGYLADYHVRSLAETVNSTFVRTIARGLRSRFPECIMSEAYMLCIVYNLIRLVHARYEFGIEIPWADERAMRIIDGIDESPQLD